MSTPMTMTAGDAMALDHEALAYFAGRRREQWRRRLLPALGLIGLIVLWWALVEGFDVKPFIAPSPQLVAQTMVAKWSVLWQNLIPTAIEALGGFLMGNGMEPKMVIAALICFFPTLVNMVRGLEAVNPQSMELMRVLSASKSEIFFKLRLYNSLPYLFSALKIAASTSVIGAVVGEWIGSTRGIGALIIQATYSFDSALLYSAVIMSSLFSGAFFLLITMIEKLVVKWQPANVH